MSQLAEITTQTETPMLKKELLPFEGEATKENIRLYQRKIGPLSTLCCCHDTAGYCFRGFATLTLGLRHVTMATY